MARSKPVKIHSFPGVSTEDMVSYLMPLINKRPDHILLHIGTNNLATSSPQETAENILAFNTNDNQLRHRGIRCSVFITTLSTKKQVRNYSSLFSTG